MTQKISGYRELTQTEIDTINSIKLSSAETGELIERVKAAGADPRWVAIGATQLQQGFMALTRSIAKPEGF